MLLFSDVKHDFLSIFEIDGINWNIFVQYSSKQAFVCLHFIKRDSKKLTTDIMRYNEIESVIKCRTVLLFKYV